jgi:hypothetical protein
MGFGDGDSDLTKSVSFSALFTKNNFQMSGFGQIHEILGVSAPKLVLFAVIEHSFSPVGSFSPLTFEFLFNCVGKLNEISYLTGEHS